MLVDYLGLVSLGSADLKVKDMPDLAMSYRCKTLRA